MAPPQAGPIMLATLGILLSSWKPAVVYPQGASNLAPLIQAPAAGTAPPPNSNTLLYRILSSWTPDPLQVLVSASVAGNIAATPDQPPMPGAITAQILRRSWDSTFLLITGAKLAPLIQLPITPDQPPIPGRQVLQTILKSWEPPFAYPQGLADQAPVIVPPTAPSAPPVQSYALLYRLRASWDPAFQMPAHSGMFAPLLPIPSSSPSTRINCYGLGFNLMHLGAWKPS